LLLLAQTRPYVFLTDKEKRKREAERVQQFQGAIRLATQSLDVHADQPRASEIVAVAHLGLGDYEAAEEVYRNLVPNYPTFADGIRVYADSMAQAELQAQLYDQAKKLALVSLALQANRPEALKILLKAQLQLLDVADAAETAAKLKALDPPNAAEVSMYAARLAATAFAGKRFEDAAAVAKVSLDLKPDQWESVATLAKAQFALADFSGAAKSYRKLLDVDPSDTDVIRAYADSLAVGKPTVQEAGEWLAHVRLDNLVSESQVRVELAGVLLTRGDGRPAQNIILEAQGTGRNRVAPELLGRLGWWYYRAERYSTSAELLRQAIAQRPGDLTLQAALGFDEVEENQMDDAIRLFTVAAGDNTRNSSLMGRAVARWKINEHDEAMQDFEAATKASPEWRNPRWVQGLYSGTVVQSVSKMLLESGKRADWHH
jgi:tetratricopeptide (TPR) repeat protein